MSLRKKEKVENKKQVNQQMVDAVHTHTHTGNNLNKRKRKVVCVVSLSLIVMILGIIAYSENIKPLGVIENIKRALEEKIQSSNAVAQSDVTTVDVTGIELGKETQHEHIYKTMYDKNKHWEECQICNIKRNELSHTITTTWRLGYESCEYENSYTNTCVCGYSYSGHKPCVWDGKTFYKWPDIYQHRRVCTNNHQIMYDYFWNGNLYYTDIQGTNCYLTNTQKIVCGTAGTCRVCSSTYTQSMNNHYLGINNSNEIYCVNCNKKYGKSITKITRDSNLPSKYTIRQDITLINGATFKAINDSSVTAFVHMNNWEKITSEWQSVELNTQTQYSIITTGKIKSTIKEYFAETVRSVIDINGTSCNFSESINVVSADSIKPTISSISVENNTIWKKSKKITISGTENFCNTISIKIIDSENNIVFSGKSSVNNGKYSITCIPELEADSIGRNFKVIVTDACDNSTEKEFTILKIDSIPPEVTSDDKISEGWAKEKNITFTASDRGIGNIQIAFNDVSDYKLANKNGTEYSREYKLTGDVYSPREANVYYKDELGNISTKKITINKLDNTAPSITGVSFINNKLNIEAHDMHKTEGEGSGIVKYRFITSQAKLEKPEITTENSTEVAINENIIIPNIDKVRYVYIVAEDLVGNISESYEVKVPQLELTSKVNLSGANGKGAVELDWSSYDISNKYFVIYRKQENETEWETIISLEEKFNGNKYTDNLGNDRNSPNALNINIEGKQENNNIEINRSSNRHWNEI